jgi:hypothetical protein
METTQGDFNFNRGLQMPTLTLSTKIHNESQLEFVGKFLKSMLKGLKVEAKICGVTPRGRIQVLVSGEDEKAALSHIANEIGLCPTHLDQLKKFETVEGRISSLGKSKCELDVDIGIHLPKQIDATVPLQYLQAQLTDGRKVAMKKIAELFGFCEGLPLDIKIFNIKGESVEAVFSEKQLLRYKSWMKSLLDRLIIIGSSINEVKAALKKAGLNRDTTDIQRLGLFEYAVTCKLGTDAAGLIPKIGKHLRKAAFTVFNPKNTLEFLDYPNYF